MGRGSRAAGALVALCLAGCTTQQASRPATTVTVTRAAPATTHASSASASATTSAPATLTKLPGSCDDMLSLPVVEDALNRNVLGRTAFVVGVAEADIGRLGYVNCRYGMATAQSPPAIEIGISLYRTAADAAKRIPATVDDFLAHGATSTTSTVSGVPATLLLGGSGAGYGPTIVLASGPRTVAVTMAANATHNARADLTTLAALALRNSAG